MGCGFGGFVLLQYATAGASAFWGAEAFEAGARIGLVHIVPPPHSTPPALSPDAAAAASEAKDADAPTPPLLPEDLAASATLCPLPRAVAATLLPPLSPLSTSGDYQRYLLVEFGGGDSVSWRVSKEVQMVMCGGMRIGEGKDIGAAWSAWCCMECMLSSFKP